MNKYLTSILILTIAMVAGAGETWTRNTFPGKGHAVNGFPEGQGADRCEYITAFGVSPHMYKEGWWIMMSTDLGPLLSSENGSDERYAEFKQLDFPFYAPKAINFNPHHKYTAYVIKTDGNTDDGRSGMYRTQDKAKTWVQIFREPAGEKGVENSGRQTGQCEIAADPHPMRKDHLYYAHGARGLFRTTVAHEPDGEKVIKSWDLIHFGNRRVNSIWVGAKGDTTIIYAYASYGNGWRDPGEAWCIEVSGKDGETVTKTRILQEFGANVFTICGNPANADEGFFSAFASNEKNGVYKFTQRGEKYEHALQPNGGKYQWPRAIKVNPSNPLHVVVGGSSDRNIPEDGFCYYSMDGGKTWKGETPPIVKAMYKDANGEYENYYWPNYKLYGPTNWRAGDNPNLPKKHWWALDLSSPWHYGYAGGKYRGGSIGSEAGLFHFDFLPGDENDFMALGISWGPRELVKTNNDYGETLTPYGYGLQFKQPLDVSFGSSEMVRAVPRAEHGVHLTRDGGKTWRGITHAEDPTLSKAVSASKKTGWRMKSCTSAAFDPDDDKRLIINWGSPKKGKGQETILFSDNFGESWKIIHAVKDTLDVHHWGVGSTRLWWQKKNDEDRIYVEHFRCTDPGTWTFEPMTKRVVEVHPKDADVLIGTTSSRSGNGGMKDFVLSLSRDAGRTWTDLPVVPKETTVFKRGKYELAPRTVAGFSREYRPIAFDPSVNPNKDGKLRILLAGRSGIYEYVSTNADGSAGTWTLLNSTDFNPLPDSGALTKDDIGKVEPRTGLKITSADAVGPRPFLEQVIFDPNRPNIVYAVAGYQPKGGNRDPNHGLPGMPLHPKKPIYRSLDGGKTWKQLAFPGLPTYVKPQVINVGPQGTFFVQDYGGEFSLPRPGK